MLKNDNSIEFVSQLGSRMLEVSVELAPVDETFPTPDRVADFQSPSNGEDSYFVVLTERGMLQIYHYVLVDSEKQYAKYLKDLSKKASDKEHVSKDEEKKAAAEAKEQARGFVGPNVFLQHVAVVDIPSLLKVANSTSYSNTVRFQKVDIMQSRGQRYFVVSDDRGYLTAITRDLKLKTRFFSESEHVGALQSFGTSSYVLQKNALAFTSLTDGSMIPYYCEGGFRDDYSMVAAVGDGVLKSDDGAPHLYVLTTLNEVMVFEAKVA